MLTSRCFWDKPEHRLSGPLGLEERLLAEEQEALEMRLLEQKDGITSTSCAKIKKAYKKCLMEDEVEISQQQLQRKIWNLGV